MPRVVKTPLLQCMIGYRLKNKHKKNANGKRKRKKKRKKKQIKEERKKHKELMKEVRDHRRSKKMKPSTEPALDANEVEDEVLETYDYDQLHLAFKFEDL